MRERTEQFAGLEKVVLAAAKRIKGHRIFERIAVTWWVPDVLKLELPNGMEIIYASGGYDLWVPSSDPLNIGMDTRMTRSDMTLDDAVEVIVKVATEVSVSDLTDGSHQLRRN